jgi:hypothetical protein
MENKRKSKLTLGSIIGRVCLFLGISSAVPIYGNFVGSPACSLKVFRRPTGTTDTLRRVTNGWGRWSAETDNFVPPAQNGETLYVFGGWNLGGKAKTFLIRSPPGDPENTSLDLRLDKHTLCIRNINDSSYVSDSLKLIYWIGNNSQDTMVVDTAMSLYHKFDVDPGVDTSQATHGAQAHFKFYKTKGDTTFFRNLDFTVDTTRFDAQLVRETLNFTRDSFYVDEIPDTIDFSVTEIVAPTDSVDSQSVITPMAKVKNLGNKPASGNLEMKIMGNVNYTDTTSFSELQAGDSATISFSDWTPTIPGIYTVRCSSMVANDSNPGNDAKYDTTQVFGTGIQEAKLQKYMKQRASLVTGAEFVSKYGKNYDVFDAVGRRIDILNVRENGHGNRNRNSGGQLKMYFVKEKNVLDEVRKVLVVN